MVKVDCEEITTDCDPDMLALERPGPETVQLSTLVALQKIVDELPLTTRIGSALMETTGVVTVTVTMFEFAEPPGPVHDT